MSGISDSFSHFARDLAMLSQDVEAMRAKAEKGEKPETASRKSIQQPTILKQPNEKKIEEPSMDFVVKQFNSIIDISFGG